MELELKYGIPDEDTALKIWEDDSLAAMEEESSRETLFMKAAYFDTPDHVLSSRDITFRIRMEGDRIFATLKWSGKSEGALHQREEINVPVDDEACFLSPDPSLFRESQVGQEMIGLLGDQPLESIIETRFLRKRFRIDTGSSIIEVSLDKGEMITDKGTEPIAELELELFSGNPEELTAIGNRIAETYGLVGVEESKYARGKNLLLKELR